MGEGLSSCRRSRGGAIAKQVVPLLRGLVLQRHTGVSVLVALKGVVSNAEQIQSIWLSKGRSGVSTGEAEFGCRVDGEAEVRDIGTIVEAAVGQAVIVVEAPRKLAQIVPVV